MPSKAIENYLRGFAETSPELDRVAALSPFGEAVVVPVCGEDAILDGLLDSLVDAAEEQETQTLVLLVVNQDSRTALDHRFTNQALLDRFPAFARLSHWLTLAVLDRTKGFEKCGVGTARKIGADMALKLHAKGLLTSPWIHTTDADARVALDYFNLRPLSSTPWGLGPLPLGAMVHPYTHRIEGEIGEALSLYDAYLRFYSEGLSFAGSPYAYPTIGSTLSFSAEAYAQVRGFPKKDAGEDFYFLHKLAKVAFVWPGGGEVNLICRPSNRVPFGTGQSIAKIQSLLSSGLSYEVYHPGVFRELAAWYQVLEGLADGESWDVATHGLSEPLRAGLEQLGAPAQDAVIRKTRPTPEGRLRHWHTWFDGFLTLKLIHRLRDSGFPNQPLPEAGTDIFGGGNHGFQRPVGIFLRESF